MKKEEILEKSRKENGGEDFYEKEIIRTGGEAGFYVVAVLATVFSVIEVLMSGRGGHDLWAMMYSLLAVGYMIGLKSRRKKRRRDIAIAAVLWGAVVLNSILHFRTLLAAAVIL